MKFYRVPKVLKTIIYKPRNHLYAIKYLMECLRCGKHFEIKECYMIKEGCGSYCSKKCQSLDKTGSNHQSWKGGTNLRGGYRWIKSINHPNGDKDAYVAEHRLIMEKCLGRFLTSKEVIHHINGIKTDNRLENLQLTTNRLHPKDNPEQWLIYVNRYWRN